MPLETRCRECGTLLRIQDEHLGRTIKCPKCSTIVPSDALASEPSGRSPFPEPTPSSEESESVNPYQSPDASGHAAPASGRLGTEGVHRVLRQTRPWVMLLSAFGFLAAVLMGLGTIAILVAATRSGFPGGLIMGLTYLVGTAVYFAGAYYLFAYARRIGDFLLSDATADLEAALKTQKSFWKLLGLATIGMLLLFVALIVGSVVMATLSDLRLRAEHPPYKGMLDHRSGASADRRTGARVTGCASPKSFPGRLRCASGPLSEKWSPIRVMGLGKSGPVGVDLELGPLFAHLILCRACLLPAA